MNCKNALNGKIGIVTVKGQYRKEFDMKNDLRRGDSLAPILFNIELEYVVGKTKLNRNRYAITDIKSALADDIVIMT